MPATEVHILGQKYTIRGDAPAEHIRELAKEIEGKVREVCAVYPNISPVNAMILTLFNMADELHKMKTDQDRITVSLGEKADRLAGLFD